MKAYEASNYLLSARILWDKVENPDGYPFSIPAIAKLGELDFKAPVTFIVGENGSGKSTLTEGLAVAWGFNPEGGTKNFMFNTRASHSPLAGCLRLSKGVVRARDGYFLRAESYFNAASYIENIDKEPAAGPLIINSYGGRPLHEQSHGESFMALIENRFGGSGLYILDEPESALSPSRKMSLLVRMHELVAKKSQFIVATHSPILMAYPGAHIYQLPPQGIETVQYEDTHHFQTMRGFLNNHQDMVRRLLNGP